MLLDDVQEVVVAVVMWLLVSKSSENNDFRATMSKARSDLDRRTGYDRRKTPRRTDDTIPLAALLDPAIALFMNELGGTREDILNSIAENMAT